MNIKLLHQICAYFIGAQPGTPAQVSCDAIFEGIRLESGATGALCFKNLMEAVSDKTDNSAQGFVVGIAVAAASSDPGFAKMMEEFFEKEKRKQGENVVDFRLAAQGMRL